MKTLQQATAAGIQCMNVIRGMLHVDSHMLP